MKKMKVFLRTMLSAGIAVVFLLSWLSILRQWEGLAAGPASAHAKRSEKSVDIPLMNVNDVKEILRQCPAPFIAKQDDIKTRTEVMKRLRMVQKADLSVIRQVIEYHYSSPTDNTVNDWSKIYVLNRVLFDIPDMELGKHFGGFQGITEDKFTSLWPLSTKNGELSFTGTFTTYLGAMYPVLEEFDTFVQSYKPRHNQK